MPSHTYEMTTDHDPEATWDALAPLADAAAWMPLVSAVRHASGPDPQAVGTHYTVAVQAVAMDYECVECERPNLVVWKIDDSSMEAEERWEFSAAEGGGTHVVYHTDQKMKGLNKLTTPVGALALKVLDGTITKAMEKRVDREADV